MFEAPGCLNQKILFCGECICLRRNDRIPPVQLIPAVESLRGLFQGSSSDRFARRSCISHPTNEKNRLGDISRCRMGHTDFLPEKSRREASYKWGRKSDESCFTRSADDNLLKNGSSVNEPLQCTPSEPHSIARGGLTSLIEFRRLSTSIPH